MDATAGGRDRYEGAGGARGRRGGRARDRGYAHGRERGSGRPSGLSTPFYATGAARAAFGLLQVLQTRTGRIACATYRRFDKAACIVGSLTRPWREFIDAFLCGCQHRTSFPYRVFGGGN